MISASLNESSHEIQENTASFGVDYNVLNGTIKTYRAVKKSTSTTTTNIRNLHVGSKQVNNIYVGSTALKELHVGNSKVFGTETHTSTSTTLKSECTMAYYYREKNNTGHLSMTADSMIEYNEISHKSAKLWGFYVRPVLRNYGTEQSVTSNNFQLNIYISNAQLTRYVYPTGVWCYYYNDTLVGVYAVNNGSGNSLETLAGGEVPSAIRYEMISPGELLLFNLSMFDNIHTSSISPNTPTSDSKIRVVASNSYDKLVVTGEKYMDYYDYYN